MKRLSEEMRPKFFLMEAKKKRSSSISTLVCILLVCCILLTASGVTFAFYTVKELGRLKARLSFDEKILKQLQTRYTYRQARAVNNVDHDSRNRETRSIINIKENRHAAEKPELVSIHLKGDGKMFIPNDKPRLNKWQEVHTLGLVYQKHNGTVKILQSGMYFIYSHVQCEDGNHLSVGGHSTRINGRIVMESSSGYQGGAFRLKKGDQVFKSVTCKKKIIMDPVTSRFGLFLVK